MRWIQKNKSPEEFEKWKTENQPKKWEEFPSSLPKNPEPGITYYSKSELRKHLLHEQYNKCLYCERRISSGPTKIDHVHTPRTGATPEEIFTYENLGVACHGGEEDEEPRILHCDTSKKHQILPFTPYEEICETKLDFNQLGEVIGIDDDAVKVIEILNLNCKKLQNEREAAIDGYIYSDSNDTLISSDEARKLFYGLKNVKNTPYSKAILDSLSRLFKNHQ